MAVTAVGSGGGVSAPGGSVELRELRYFVAAAEDLHFTRAAGRLHIAQQALSSAIRQLEARLGTSLFERTTRRVVLTSAGEALLPAGPGTGRGYDAAVLGLCQQAGVTPRTVQACGMLGPSGFAPWQTLGILTKTALNGVRTDFEFVRIPLPGATLPFDLAWHRDPDSPQLRMLRSVAARCATAASWPRATP